MVPPWLNIDLWGIWCRRKNDRRLHGAQDWRSPPKSRKKSQVKSIPCGAEKPPKITQVLWGNVSPSFWRELVPRRKDIARGPGTTGRLGTGAANQSSTVTKKGDSRDCPNITLQKFPVLYHDVPMKIPWKFCIN